MIQSGDVSRALQLTAAAISVIHVTAYDKLMESEAHEFADKRTAVKIFCDETLLVKPLLKKF